MSKICTGVFDGLVDGFSEPLHEAEVGLCCSWQRCSGYRSAMTGFLALEDIKIE